MQKVHGAGGVGDSAVIAFEYDAVEADDGAFDDIFETVVERIHAQSS